MKKFHKQVRNHIEKANVAYKASANKHRKQMEFNPGDLVWLHLRKEWFPSRKKNKLWQKGMDHSRSFIRWKAIHINYNYHGMWLFQPH